MTAVGYVVGAMVVELDAGSGPVAYECAITGVVENETHTDVTTQTACPDGVKTESGPSQWSLTVNYNVSLLPTSFHRILRDNAGEAATITIEPFPDTEPGHTIVYAVKLVGGGANLTVGQYGSASVTLPCTSAPTFDDTP